MSNNKKNKKSKKKSNKRRRRRITSSRRKTTTSSRKKEQEDFETKQERVYTIHVGARYCVALMSRKLTKCDHSCQSSPGIRERKNTNPYS